MENLTRQELLEHIRKGVKFNGVYNFSPKCIKAIKEDFNSDVEIAIEVFKKSHISQKNILKDMFSSEVFANQMLWIALSQNESAGFEIARNFMDENLKKNSAFLLLIASNLENNNKHSVEEILSIIDKEMLKKPDFVSMLVGCAPSAIAHLGDEFIKNPKFIAKAISENTEILTNRLILVHLDVETLQQAHNILASKYMVNDEFDNKVAFAIDTIMQSQAMAKQSSKSKTSYKSGESLTPNSRRRPNYIKGPDGSTYIEGKVGDPRAKVL